MKDLPERPTFKLCYSPPALKPKPEPVYVCPVRAAPSNRATVSSASESADLEDCILLDRKNHTGAQRDNQNLISDKNYLCNYHNPGKVKKELRHHINKQRKVKEQISKQSAAKLTSNKQNDPSNPDSVTLSDEPAKLTSDKQNNLTISGKVDPSHPRGSLPRRHGGLQRDHGHILHHHGYLLHRHG